MEEEGIVKEVMDDGSAGTESVVIATGLPRVEMPVKPRMATSLLLTRFCRFAKFALGLGEVCDTGTGTGIGAEGEADGWNTGTPEMLLFVSIPKAIASTPGIPLRICEAAANCEAESEPMGSANGTTGGNGVNPTVSEDSTGMAKGLSLPDEDRPSEEADTNDAMDASRNTGDWVAAVSS